MEVAARSHGQPRPRLGLEVGPRFACHFFRRNPTSERLSRSCSQLGFPSISKLNEHLKNVHLAAGEVTDDQLAKIRSLRDSREESSAKWRRIYGILFPADDRVPPPFSPSPEQLQRAARSPHPQVIADWKRRINIHGFHVLEEETKDNLLRLCSGMICPFIDAVNEVGLLSTDASDTTSSPPLAGTSDWIQRWAGIFHESEVTQPPFTNIGLPEPGASALRSSDNLLFSDEGGWPIDEGNSPF